MSTIQPQQEKAMVVHSQAFKDTVKKGLDYFKVPSTPAMIEQLTFHASEMLFWNKKTNLTAITDPYDVAVKHIIDSAAAFPLISQGASVLDLGSGGGFPGIPLKILNPSLDMILVDSSRKKVSFMKHVIRTKSLTGIRAFHARGEELKDDKSFCGCFDYVISRAFSGLDVFVPMALPFLKENGRIIAMKGKEIDHEKSLLTTITGTAWDGRQVLCQDLSMEQILYRLPFIESQRALFVIGLKNKCIP
ncbi:MAG: 16S rRNA (guanine(527)-N(7))-methyltransferase RsmG [Proteobacteria bacterium]|nr:16S rRNA (guanine(527)-N(7))-methyltransferase RsmG [Pseudomonadota bacterium]